MSSIFPRPKLAAEMAKQLQHPSVLDEGLRSWLFLSGLRRTGKTTFLLNDLIPALEEAGALVIYVDLWSDTQENPASLVQAAVQNTLLQRARRRQQHTSATIVAPQRSAFSISCAPSKLTQR